MADAESWGRCCCCAIHAEDARACNGEPKLFVRTFRPEFPESGGAVWVVCLLVLLLGFFAQVHTDTLSHSLSHLIRLHFICDAPNAPIELTPKHNPQLFVRGVSFFSSLEQVMGTTIAMVAKGALPVSLGAANLDFAQVFKPVPGHADQVELVVTFNAAVKVSLFCGFFLSSFLGITHA